MSEETGSGLVMGKYRRLSRSLKKEIAMKYYTSDFTQKELAAEYGIAPGTVNIIVNDVKLMKEARELLNKEMQKADIRRTLASMRAVNAAPGAINQIIKIAGQSVEDTPMQYQYIIQNAAQQILDRAGVKAPTEQDGNEVVVRFADPEGLFKPGMPDLENGEVTADDYS